MLNIEPIKLLRGSHKDTGQTGQGCFMNVIAYLNGEPQITDKSTCVCPVVRPIAIWLNDYMTDAERGQLIPFIFRAMGSATSDVNEAVRRAKLAVEFAANAANAANAAAANAANAAYAAAVCAANAAYAANAAAAYAAAYAAAKSESAECAAAARSAAAYAAAAKSAKSAKSVAKSAAESAAYAAYAADRNSLISAGLDFLDKALPAATEPMLETARRAEQLVELCKKSGLCV